MFRTSPGATPHSLRFKFLASRCRPGSCVAPRRPTPGIGRLACDAIATRKSGGRHRASFDEWPTPYSHARHNHALQPRRKAISQLYMPFLFVFSLFLLYSKVFKCLSIFVPQLQPVVEVKKLGWHRFLGIEVDRYFCCSGLRSTPRLRERT